MKESGGENASEVILDTEGNGLLAATAYPERGEAFLRGCRAIVGGGSKEKHVSNRFEVIFSR